LENSFNLLFSLIVQSSFLCSQLQDLIKAGRSPSSLIATSPQLEHSPASNRTYISVKDNPKRRAAAKENIDQSARLGQARPRSASTRSAAKNGSNSALEKESAAQPTQRPAVSNNNNSPRGLQEGDTVRVAQV
jgi:hypothetical protein